MKEQKNKMVIESITAIVSVDSDGNEGIMAFSHNGMMMPMVCADHARLDSLFLMAQHISQESGMPFRVLEFSNRADLTDVMG